MEGSLPRPARSRPLEQPQAPTPPARRRDLPLVLSLLAALAITFVLTENRRIERRSPSRKNAPHWPNSGKAHPARHLADLAQSARPGDAAGTAGPVVASAEPVSQYRRG